MTQAGDGAPLEARGCTLAPAALAGRIGEWRALTAHALRRRVEPGRVVTTYPNQPDIAQRLARLVAAEEDCCAFLDFDVHHDDTVITVELRYPARFAPLLTAVFGGAEPT